MPRALVLSAGFGSRLRPLTEELPKPLLPFGDRCLLDHALRALDGRRLSGDVMVNVHHLAGCFEAYRERLSRPVELIHESNIRGTAGGIAGTRERLDGSGLVVAIADVVLDQVPEAFMEAPAWGSLVLALRRAPAGRGNVGVGQGGEVVRLRGERFGAEAWSGNYVGLCALSQAVVADLPDVGCLIGDYALPVLRSGGRVLAFEFDGECSFPGDDLPGYLAANLAWLQRRNLEQFCAPGSQIAAGVELRRALLSRGARVSGSGRLERVIACEEAEIQAPLQDACVLPSGRVVPIAPPTLAQSEGA
ncbi:MAG TPA: sugar phosphate nucleotidyltransferase [Polyangiaceae bacterium]|nr:sugar phosphate nucleotidyltransferase [Polyangiaceae bacterium]